MKKTIFLKERLNLDLSGTHWKRCIAYRTYSLIKILLRNENDYWQFNEGKYKKCGSNKLYLREVAGGDYADRVVCKECGTEFSRD